MNRLLPSLVLLLALLLLALFPAASRSGEIVLSEAIQLQVADAFMDEREYYRAITEYKRFLILFPVSDRVDYALWKTGLAYYEGEDYEAAARTFASLQTRCPESGYVAAARYYEGLSYRGLKDYEHAERAFSDLADSHPRSEYAPMSMAAQAAVALERRDPASGKAALVTLLDRYPESPLAGKAEAAMALLDRYEVLPEKSPVLAGVMSAVVPGSGYFYAEHYGDGIMALLVNGLAIAGTVTALFQENYAVAAVVGGIGAPFYLGNIYGSVNAARKWNLALRNELRGRILLTLEVPF